jgi:hypothetical protein
MIISITPFPRCYEEAQFPSDIAIFFKPNPSTPEINGFVYEPPLT